MTIDECLYATANPMAFLVYNPDKPAKYGFLIKEVNEAIYPYCHRFEIFAGKPHDIDNAVHYCPGVENVTLKLVDKLRDIQDLTGCTIAMDNYYTGISLAQKLLERNITMIGN